MSTKDWWWGRSASVDLHDCDPMLVKSPFAIKRFVKQLAKELKMPEGYALVWSGQYENMLRVKERLKAALRQSKGK